MIYADITQMIGKTPVVRINHLAPSHVTIYVKVEAANPGLSRIVSHSASSRMQNAEER
jgi:cysteine synthase